MISPSEQALIQRAAQLVNSARHAVVLSGAGLSTHSGIPDFRSQGSGLWQKDDPMEVSSLTTFRRNPQRFYNWLRPLAESMWKAQPNPAHIALAQMERYGKLKAVMTQNIDGLHQRAGSQAVLEVHGSLETLSCLVCGKNYPSAEFADLFITRGVLPRCGVCQAVLKPDIVLFEEMLPQRTWRQAERHCQTADVMLVIGSSLQVMPAAHLPAIARQNGARLVLVNFSPTYLDDEAEIILRADLVEAVPAILESLTAGGL